MEKCKLNQYQEVFDGSFGFEDQSKLLAYFVLLLVRGHDGFTDFIERLMPSPNSVLVAFLVKDMSQLAP